MQHPRFGILHLFDRKAGIIFFLRPVGERLERIYVRTLRPINHIHCKFDRILNFFLFVFGCGFFDKLLTDL